MTKALTLPTKDSTAGAPLVDGVALPDLSVPPTRRSRLGHAVLREVP